MERIKIIADTIENEMSSLVQQFEGEVYCRKFAETLAKKIEEDVQKYMKEFADTEKGKALAILHKEGF